MSSFFSFFYSKPKAEEVMAATNLTSEEPIKPITSPVKSTTEDSQSEPQSPVNLLTPPQQTQPTSSQSPSSQPDSLPQTPKEQENSTVSEDQTSNSYTDDEILLYIAENNELNVPWSKVMRIIKERLEKTCQDSEIPIEEHKIDVENYKQTINQLLDNFESPPFTIQRLSELILKPFQHHKTLIKWLRAVEKVLTVQSSLDAFPSISNTITLTDKLELMEVTTSPKLVPISFAYNAEEIEKENANSPKLVPIKFAYSAELEVADNEEEADDDMNEDYYYKQEFEDDLDEIDEENIDEEEDDDIFAEKSKDNVGKFTKKKRDYNVEGIEENEGIKKVIKKKKEDNLEDNIFEDVGKDDDVDSLFEGKNKIIENKEKGENDRGNTMEDKIEKILEKKEGSEGNTKDNMIEEKDKKNVRRMTEEKGEVIDEKTIKSEENDEGSVIDNKIENVSEENVEDNKKEKNKDQENELFKRSENVMKEGKTEEEKFKEIKEKIKKRIK